MPTAETFKSPSFKRDLAFQIKIVKDADENDKAYLDKETGEEESLTVQQTFGRIAKESFPIITSSIFFQLVNQMNIIFVG